VGRVKEAQAHTIDGLGTVAVLLLLFCRVDVPMSKDIMGMAIEAGNQTI
jgi:hypothetical protein